MKPLVHITIDIVATSQQNIVKALREIIEDMEIKDPPAHTSFGDEDWDVSYDFERWTS